MRICLQRWIGWLQDFLFPLRTCIFCRKHGHFSAEEPWCAACAEEMRREMAEKNFCICCGRGIEAGHAACELCTKEPPLFQAGVHIGPYEGKLKQCIRNLKYHEQKILAAALGRMLAEKIRERQEFSACEVVVPVPLSQERKRERGFNQSELLARKIADETGKALDVKTLCRKRNTQSQTGFGPQERRQNIAGAFEAGEELAGKTVLLVDDVYTTGATTGECARVLLEKGVRAVWVAAAAAVAQNRKPAAEEREKKA